MELIAFSEIFEFQKKSKIKAGDGLSINEGEYPFYTSSNILSKSINEFQFEGDSLIFGTGGQASIHFCDNRFSVSTDCFVTKPKNIDLVYTKFVYYYLAGNIHILEKGFKGAGLKHISKDYLQKIQIPLPSLEVQKAIVARLDKADEVRQLNQQIINHYEELIQALFIDMFGDPVKNEKGWEKNNFGNYIKILTDYHANGSYESLKEVVTLKDEIDFALMVRTTDLENNNFTDDVKYISEVAYNFLSKSKVFGNEIIMNKIGSAGNIYLMPELDRPVSLGMNAFLIRIDESKVNNIYIFNLLKTDFGMNEIKKRVKGAVTKTIKKEAVREIPIVIPPIELQNQFAERVQKIEAQKELAEQALQQSENLFNSLLQQAFKK